MKYNLIVLLSSVALAVTSCKDENSKYVDPSTGKSLELVKDANTGLMVDAETKKPVYIYVDTEKKDTIYGETGKVINGKIVLEDGKYVYADYKVKAEDGEYKIKDGDYKEKVEKDGDIKIKDGDTKVKIDGETGEKKVK
ncbi:MAG: hypothetical protein ABIR18_09990 [Chitinophagaceae bacterium]